MSKFKEGNLEAPTRHPLNWKDKDFYNEDSLNNELERVFCLLYTSPSPRDLSTSRMPSSA